MNDAFGAELILGCIPQRVVGVGVFQFLQRVEVGSLVLRMFSKGRFCPFRERGILGVIFNHRTVDEPDVSPGDDLVEEGFNRFGQAPPALSAAVVWRVDHADVPTMMRENIVKNSVNADVSEMEPWRETASASFLRFVSLFMIELQPVGKELFPATTPFDITATLPHHRVNIVVDTQGGEGLTPHITAFGHAPQEFVGRHGRTGLSENGFGHGWVKFGKVGRCLEGATGREFMHVFSNRFVKMTAK